MQVNRFKTSFAEKVKNLDWLGGFFDGEGCIYFTETSRKYKETVYPEVQVILAQSGVVGYELMRALQNEYGFGKITSSHGSELTKQIPYMTRLSGKKALVFLKTLHPYLLIKQQKAEEVITYMEHYYAS